MTIEDIKTYDELDDYCKDVGYENLTDEDIDALCAKVREIRDAIIEDIKAKEKNPDLGLLSISAACMQASNKCESLRNCTEERKIANIHRRFEEEDRRAGGIISDTFLMTSHEIEMERSLH